MAPPRPLAERNLLSRFKGDAKPQSTSARPAPSLALSLRVGSEEEETQKNRPMSASIHGHDHPSYPSQGRGSSGQGRVPQQPVPPPASPSPSPPAAALHMCSFYYGQLRAATADVDKLRAMNWDLSRQMLSLQEELMLERIFLSAHRNSPLYIFV